jgi:cobalt-zinc-cadmium efflux system outer membrane protein
MQVPVVCAQDKTPPMTMPMNQQMPHHHGDVPLVAPQYPRMGRSQEKAGAQLVTLEQVEKMATETNPTLRQAEAEIRAAKARQQQAGLYPNPTVGYTGDEIRGGLVGGGKQGFFVQQTIVTGGKLGKSREVFGAEAKLAEFEPHEQRTRGTTAVKRGFHRVRTGEECSKHAATSQKLRKTPRRRKKN